MHVVHVTQNKDINRHKNIITQYNKVVWVWFFTPLRSTGSLRSDSEYPANVIS